MIHSRRLVATLALATALAAPLAARAQPASAPSGTASAEQAAVEQRIAALQSRLGITPDQVAAWTSFAQAMRDTAASTDQLFSQRAADTAKMTAPQNMRSYAVIARAYADSTGKLADAFDTLYAKLSEAQKQTADTLFRPPLSSRGRR